MKPILVHAHVYYPEMWPELKACVANIAPHSFKVFVTLSQAHQDVVDDVKTSFNDAEVEVVENRGFDVGPFIHVLNRVNLDEYSYIVKLHTKRDLGKEMSEFCRNWFRNLSDSKWRDALLSFIQTKENFEKTLKAFEDNPKIGMQNCHQIIIHHDFYDRVSDKAFKAWLQEKELPFFKSAFVGGTMFIARAEIFKDLQQLGLTLKDFPDPKGGHNAQLAHIIERFLGYIVYKNKMICANGLCSQKEEERYHRNIYIRTKYIDPLIRFFYQKKMTKSGKELVKILRIPIFRK
jgi:lipopolysaccharide biosynthesis protein